MIRSPSSETFPICTVPEKGQMWYSTLASGGVRRGSSLLNPVLGEEIEIGMQLVKSVLILSFPAMRLQDRRYYLISSITTQAVDEY